MRRNKSAAAVILAVCLLICLAGCAQEDTPTSVPTVGTTVPTTAPIDPQALYADAKAKLAGAENLVLTYTYDQSRTVGGEEYTEKRAGTASYADLGTDSMEAMIRETLSYGAYSTQYIESFLSGSAYCRVNNCSFRCNIGREAFMALQLPALLLDDSLYETVTAEIGDTTLLTFTGASVPEAWVTGIDGAELISAQGTVTLDAGGAITAAAYHAEYTLSAASYTLDVSVTVETPETLDFSAEQPVYPEECPEISDLRIPRYLLQAVGDISSAQNISATYSDRIYSEAYGYIRYQSNTYDTYGSGDDFMASLTSQVSITNYAGITETTSQSILYRDGVCTNSFNGGEPAVDSTATADSTYSTCTAAILSSLMAPDLIAGAEILDTGDFLCINFTSTDNFANNICSNIYSMFSVNLDLWAESYTTETAGGYLTVNKYTQLPTAMGMELSRDHVIDGVTCKLHYQLDQAVVLSSPNAYENITGEALPEAAAAESATPLFYKVTGTNGQTMWLLGTIHVGDSRTGSLPQELTDAFDASDALAVEFDLMAFESALLTDSALLQQVAAVQYYGDNTTVSSHVPSELYGRLYPMMLASGSNSVTAPYLRTVIWQNLIEDFYLRQSCSLTAGQGMDSRLLDWAYAEEKTIYEIESGLSQQKVLTGFSDALQSWLLESTLDTGMTGYCAQLTALYELWCQGDEEALTQALTDDTSTMTEDELVLYNEYYKAIITNRNKTMLQAAKKYLESDQTVFYAVGLAHLLGEDGLVKSLQNAGYTVELVSYSE